MKIKINWMKGLVKCFICVLMMFFVFGSIGMKVCAEDNCYSFEISGVRHYDLAWDVLESVNEKREANGKSKMILEADLTEMHMVYAAEQVISRGMTRPNGLENNLSCIMQMSSFNKGNVVNSITNYVLEDRYEDYQSLGLGIFYSEEYYYIVVGFYPEGGVETAKTEAEEKNESIQILKNHVAWASETRKVYLKNGESEQLSVRMGYTENEGGSIGNTSLTVPASLMTWESADSSIVNVDSNGKVTGVSSGKTTISAYFDGNLVCQWEIGVDLSEDEINERVTIQVSGTRYYNHILQALEWINEWRLEEGLEPVTLTETFDEKVWKQAAAMSVRMAKYPGSQEYFSGISGGYSGSCGYGPKYYQWIHTDWRNVLDPDFKSVSIACFENDNIFYWSALWSTEPGDLQIPSEPVYGHEDIKILKDHLAYRAEPSGNILSSVGKKEKVKLYQGYMEDGMVTMIHESLMDLTLLTWESDDPEVAVMGEDGQILCKGAGSTVIKAIRNGEVICRWKVTVKEKITESDIEVDYTGPTTYDGILSCPDDKYNQYFTIKVNGETLKNDEFKVYQFAKEVNESGTLCYFDIQFIGVYEGEYRFYLNLDDENNEKPTSNLPFTDVPQSKWFYNAVKWAYTNGFLTGTSETTFSPNDPMTRGMLVTVLYRKEGRPVVTEANKFPDVNSKKYYAPAITWASSEGLVSGYSNGAFGPEDSITREQLAKVLFLYAKYKGYDVTASADLSGFSDASKVSSYAKKYMQWTVAEGLIQGSNGKLNPQGNATRAEISAILKRFVEKYEVQ